MFRLWSLGGAPYLQIPSHIFKWTSWSPCSLFTDYTEDGQPGGPDKVFEVRMVGRTPVTRWLGRLVRARYLRIIPVEFRHTFYLRGDHIPSGGGRVTVLRCKPGLFACQHIEECVPVSVLCDGRPDCKDSSDEINCGTAPTKGSPGLQNQTSSSGGPGFHGDSTTGAPGLHTTRSPRGHDRSPWTASHHKLFWKTWVANHNTLMERYNPDDDGKPRVLCVEGQFVCRSFGCVDSAQVCDGRQDCLDGSDEERCGTTARPAVTTRAPQVPSPCSHKQFSCKSGECVHLDRRCDLQKDCVDGSDEKDCVDCIMSPWTAWSVCSVSCGLGSLFRQRDILREALPGGTCGGAQFDGRACFPRACPVDGHWAEWSEWSECDAQCGGGNGGRDCGGMTLQSQSCNSQPCTKDIGTQTGCVEGMVLVTEADCQAGRVEPCPPTCSHLSSSSNCTAACGCRCPNDRYLQGGRCVNSSQCVCLWHGHTLQPGQTVNRDQCTTCVCIDGQVTCDSSLCVAACHWSTWSLWSPCDVTCGLGLQQRYRSPVNQLEQSESNHVPETPLRSAAAPPPAALMESGVNGPADDVGIRRRYRSCNHTLTHFNNTHADSACDGDSEEPEPCNTVHCPVNGGCMGQQLPGATHSDRRLQLTPLLRCVSRGHEVECATTCYDGCYCAPGFYLLNGSCVPLAHCPCYHQGGTYPAGTTLPVDTCNNCTCTNGEMVCGAASCPVDCGWRDWTQWSACSRTCDVGVRRRYRSGTNPPAAFGGRPCRGDRVGIDTCSLEPCFGVKEPWSAWSTCSVTCGGGYRARTRGPIRIHGTSQQFSACNLQACGEGGVCPPGQQWKQCVKGAVSCTDLTMDLGRNCTPGCQCPHGTVQQVVDGQWSSWTPWGRCSVSCGAGLQSRYRFCSSPQRSGSGLPCLGPHREDQVCLAAPCDRDGGWGRWSNWTDCTKSCGGGVQSRRRECDSPRPEGEGNYCEGLGSEVIACNTNHCPVAPCSKVPGTAFSSCGPSCPRSCDDLAHCEWQCEPGCYCTEGKILSANGTVCVEREDCPCIDLSTDTGWNQGRPLKPLMGVTTALVRVVGSTAPDTSVQCQAAGVSGQSGLRAQGPVERSLCPATGAAAVLRTMLEEWSALENRKYTTGSEFKSRDSHALS
ncbi:hypothetical protein KUCAC02_017425 [Chaenocephalus aceratus]|uniref:Uncharacterized protein n=1 Tax=Chaenocephalus aceratus TaxID=36190 RepID=A0ACB9W295_CHAAC|nr:hypothetical protein KUCAC02_017425 [Chaenocephalus aceratus]